MFLLKKTFMAYITLWTVINWHEWCGSSSSVHSFCGKKINLFIGYRYLNHFMHPLKSLTQSN